MDELAFSFRRGLLSRERTYRLGPGFLEWNPARGEGRVAYGEVEAIRVRRYKVRGALAATTKRLWRCVVYCPSGRRIILLPTHYVRAGVVEDRSSTFDPFVRELVGRVAGANPKVQVRVEDNWSVKWAGALGRAAGPVTLAALRAVRYFDLAVAAQLAAWFMRRIGPRLRQHRTARANLVAAYPEKSIAEIEQILRGMWDNIGYLAAEYAHLDRLWDSPVGKHNSRVEWDHASEERFLRLRDDAKPALIFFGHLANFELIGIVACAFGLKIGVLYRHQHIGVVDDAIEKMRMRCMATLMRPIRAGFGAALAIDAALKDGTHVGMPVDQHVADGVDVTFFGRRCKVDASLARFARRLECPIHGARVIRLPGHRFRCEMTEAIESPCDTDGRIDVAGTMQTITAIVESWVREHPEQWIWAHRRWR
jgi:KDO2-lipid IV(A) lauroyltransferase